MERNTEMNVDDTTSTASAHNTSYLACPGGRVGYDVAGEGPLVVLVPGMGDLRAGYRFLAPALREAGYRVACTDLRGHGDSDTTFSSYGKARELHQAGGVCLV
jgi:pimeloyl-ACP methyl ester carboxylesterase